MFRETGNNISICTYNATEDVDRKILLEEICGTATVTVTETDVNVLECNVPSGIQHSFNRTISPIKDLGRPIIPPGSMSGYNKEIQPNQLNPDQLIQVREDDQGHLGRGWFSNSSWFDGQRAPS